MAVVDVFNSKGEQVSQKELPEEIFNVPVRSSILHDVVTMQLTVRRSGSASVKRRSDVRGSGRKLFRQKGTGRARRGNIKSPLLRGGGVVFGPSPKVYSHKLPRKVRKLALKMALSSKYQKNEIAILNQFDLTQIKTKAFADVLDALGKKNVLVVTDGKDDILELSSRNIPHVKVLRSEGLNVYDILKFRDLILMESSVEKIEGRLT